MRFVVDVSAVLALVRSEIGAVAAFIGLLFASAILSLFLRPPKK